MRKPLAMLIVFSAQAFVFALSSDDNNGSWADRQVLLRNTSEAQLMVRAGDIDNFGFGWPEDFDPFTGRPGPEHSFPWTTPDDEIDGTDRIMVVSSYLGEEGDCQTPIRPAPCGPIMPSAQLHLIIR